MESTHGWMTSSVAYHHLLWTTQTDGRYRTGMHHLPWTTHTIGLHRARHAIMSLGDHTQSDYIRVSCDHYPWNVPIDGRRQALHAIITLGQHKHTNDVGYGMSSTPFHNTHGRIIFCVACPHGPWAAHTVERSRSWHPINSVPMHTRSGEAGIGKPSSPLDIIKDRRRRIWHVINVL